MGELPADNPQVIEFGPFRLDRRDLSLRRDGLPVHITKRSFEMLFYIAGRRGDVVSDDDLKKHVWKAPSVSQFGARILAGA